MKILMIAIAVLLSVPLFAETYTDTEFVVEGQPTTSAPVMQPGTTTVITTTTGAYPVSATTTVVNTTTEAPIYVGMGKNHVLEVMGHPTNVDKFRAFAARQPGIYDEVWTYQTPTGVTYVYIKERRVLKVEYR